MDRCALKEKQCRFESYAHFKREELILYISEKTGRYGIITSGDARVVQIDESGRQTILEVLSVGECFGEQFYYQVDERAIYVVANSECDIHFINMSKALAGCGTLCKYRDDLLKRILMLSIHQLQKQNIHLDVLRRRTLREKILTFLSYHLIEYLDEEVIEIPFSLSEMALYLNVDRSAMMREIKNMNTEGIIKSKGRHFIIMKGNK